MSNELMRPIDPATAKAIEESAKLGGKLVDAGLKTGSYFDRVLGQLPENLIGLWLGDKVAHKRIRRLAELQEETKKILHGRGVQEPYEDPSLSIAIPLIEAAVDETRDGLKELWVRLLAAAMDPNRKGFVRQSILTAAKQLDPLDAAVLQEIALQGGAQWTPNGRDYLVKKLNVNMEEVLVSFRNLEHLGFIGIPQAGPKINPILEPLGVLLMKAIRD